MRRECEAVLASTNTASNLSHSPFAPREIQTSFERLCVSDVLPPWVFRGVGRTTFAEETDLWLHTHNTLSLTAKDCGRSALPWLAMKPAPSRPNPEALAGFRSMNNSDTSCFTTPSGRRNLTQTSQLCPSTPPTPFPPAPLPCPPPSPCPFLASSSHPRSLPQCSHHH